MHLKRGLQIGHIGRSIRFQSTNLAPEQSSTTLTTADGEPIVIPMRIKRGPADILKALAATVGRDETAAHYKFMDDPYLLPTSENQRKLFAMSKEAGRKAALYLAGRFPFLIAYEQDEPRIESFRPTAKPLKSDLENLWSPKFLLHCMDQGWMTEATACYEKVEADCDSETKLKFLEFLSFHNCADPVESEFREQSYYRTYFGLDTQLKSVWKTDGLADQIFQSIEPKSVRSYAAVICGMTKYSNYSSAHELFVTMKEQFGLDQVDLNVIEAALTCLPYVSNKPEESWRTSLELLQTMAEIGLRPRTTTFNILLASVKKSAHVSGSDETSLKIFREMKALGVEPSLATYYYLLFCHQRSQNLGSLVDFTVGCLEHYCPPCSDKNDPLYFPYCMELIAEKLNDKNFAYRLHCEVVTRDENYRLLNDFQLEHQYYSHLVSVLSRFEEPEKFVQFFETIFPHVFAPEIPLLLDVIRNIEMFGAQHLLPRLYPSILAAGYFKISGTLVKTIISAMYHASDVEFDTKRQFGDVAFDLKEKVGYYIEEANRLKRNHNVKWTPAIIQQLAELCKRAGQLERSQMIAATKCQSADDITTTGLHSSTSTDHNEDIERRLHKKFT